MFTLSSKDNLTVGLSGLWPANTYTISAKGGLLGYGGTVSAQKYIFAENQYNFIDSKIGAVLFKNQDVNQKVLSATDFLPYYGYAGVSATRFGTLNNIQNVLYFDIAFQTPTSTDYVSFNWKTSGWNQFKIGPCYNVFYTKPTANTNTTVEGALVYPQRLVLFPTNITRTTSGTDDIWTVQTSAAILDTQVRFLSSIFTQDETFDKIDDIRHTSLSSLGLISSAINLAYELKALYATNDSVVLTDLLHNNNYPLITIGGLDLGVDLNYRGDIATQYNPRVIRPDSIQLDYQTVLTNSQTIKQDYTDVAPIQHANFGFSYNPVKSYDEYITFNLGRSSIDTSKTPIDPANTILYGTLDVYNTRWLEFSANPLVTNLSSFNISIRYIAELAHFSNSGAADLSGVIETIGNSSLSGIFVGSVKLSAIQPVALQYLQRNSNSYTNIPIFSNYPVYHQAYASANSVSASWIIKYPPHYYSFKASLAPAVSSLGMVSALSAESNFHYHLSSFSVSLSSTGVTVSSLLVSEFNQSILDLSSCRFTNNNQVIEDQIYFDLVDTKDYMISAMQLEAGWAPSYDQLIIPLSANRWFPACSAKSVTFRLVEEYWAGETLTVRPKLSTLAGFVDSFEAQSWTIGTAVTASDTFDIHKISEKNNQIVLSIQDLNSVSAWPFVDLRQSNIAWSFSPTSVSATISALSGGVISPGEWVPFETNSVVSIEGYGSNTLTIYASSQKLGTSSLIQTDSSLYLIPSYIPSIQIQSVEDQNKIRKIQIDLQGLLGSSLVDYTSATPIKWSWEYNSQTDPQNIPVSAFFVSGVSAGQVYEYQNILPYVSARTLRLEVQPAESLTFDLNTLLIRAYSILDQQSGTASVTLDSYPSSTSTNAVYTIAYNLCANTPVQTISPAAPIFTRPQDSVSIFSLKANTSSLPIVSAANTILYWLSSGVGQTNYSVLSSGVTAIVLNLVSAASAIDITLSAANTETFGWGSSAHNISQTGTFYLLPSAEFFKPLQFIVYPPYSWSPSGNKLTVLSAANYSLAVSPTAYKHHINDLQDFVVSANKTLGVSEYVYSVGTTNFSISAPSSSIELSTLTSIGDTSGIPVQLHVYGQCYPSAQTSTFTALNPSTSALYTSSFLVTSTSVSGSSGFNIHPRTVEYPTISATLASTSFIALRNQNSLSAAISFQIPVSSPLILLIDQCYVDYTLSNSIWTSTQTVAGSGRANFRLTESSDESVPLSFVRENVSNFTLSAKATIVTQISSTTWSAYPSYTGETSLWEYDTQNYSTSSISITGAVSGINPHLFVSQYYQVSGEPITIQLIDLSNTTPTISGWAYNLGNGTATQSSLSFSALDITYNNPATLFLSFTAFWSDGSQYADQTAPIYILSGWNSYQQDQTRLLSEEILTLPYTEEEVLIQPNEWGVADIFNTAVERLQLNLDYLRDNSKTLNANAPTQWFGWLGCNIKRTFQGIRWNTIDTSEEYLIPSLSQAASGFNNIQDAVKTANYLYLLDNGILRIFSNTPIPVEQFWDGQNVLEQTFKSPTSIWVDEYDTVLLVADQIHHKVYKFTLDAADQTITPFLNVGGYGTREGLNRLNSPQKVQQTGDSIYVLDYNNHCIRSYSTDLGVQFIYYIPEFEAFNPIDFDVHNETGFLYVLTTQNQLFIFESNNNQPFFNKTLIDNDLDHILAISLDGVSEFFYAVSKTNVYKFSAAAGFITQLRVPSGPYKTIRKTIDHGMLVIGDHFVSVFQDTVSFFSVLNNDTTSWSLSTLMLDPEDFATALNYNRSLQRIIYNIKDFRQRLNSQFSLVSEQSTDGTVYSYFAISPILGHSLNTLVSFDSLIEQNQVLIGENEFHIPQVINRTLSQIYQALIVLKEFLDIQQQSVNALETCGEPFCWSWKAMSFERLSLPVIKFCGINPVSFEELMSNYPISNGVSTTLWNQASASCCVAVKTPLES